MKEAFTKLLDADGRAILLALVTQYVIIATIVGLSLAATMHYVVTPQVVAQFEAIEAALKRLSPR